MRLEINREKTALDSYLSAAFDVSRSLKPFAKDIIPLSNVLERMIKLIWDSGEESALLTEEPSLERIEQQSGEGDDEIPF